MSGQEEGQRLGSGYLTDEEYDARSDAAAEAFKSGDYQDAFSRYQSLLVSMALRFLNEEGVQFVKPPVETTPTELLLGLAAAASAELNERGDEAHKASLKREGDKEIERIKSDLKRDGDREIELIRRDATRELESYKVKLKKSELMFERQFEAANEMIKLFNITNPRKSYPDMDWDEAMGDIYDSGAQIESALREYANNHSAALDVDDRGLLERAESTANDIVMHDHADDREEVAARLLMEMKALRDSLLAKVQGQSSL